MDAAGNITPEARAVFQRLNAMFVEAAELINKLPKHTARNGRPTLPVSFIAVASVSGEGAITCESTTALNARTDQLAMGVESLARQLPFDLAMEALMRSRSPSDPVPNDAVPSPN